jgi:NADPH:quinone reductase-like Zn-dependent oxidoreductase
MPANTAAWLGSRRARAEVAPAPYTRPRADEIVVRNRAVAVNPLDWIIQVAGHVMYTWLRYPFVLGADLAGEVVEVGAAVTRFAPGDRVLGHAVGSDKDRNAPAEGAFQAYTVLLAAMAAPIPANLPYENAAVLPLGLSTAACALFQKDQLALSYPGAAPPPAGQSVLVWGGSTSVGSNAIQLAVAAGYEVITTASPRNFGYAEKLGASQVFDYSSPTVVADITAALQGKTLAGALAVGTGSAGPCADIVCACAGRKFIALASPGASFEKLDGRRGGRLRLLAILARLASSGASLQVKCRLRGIRTKFVFGTTLKGNEVAAIIYEGFLPAALADGRYVAAPDPLVIGTGLESVQAGLDAHRAGVSARKVVITL